jgi:hypothetical protein
MPDLVWVDEVWTLEEFQRHPEGMNGKESMWTVRDLSRRGRLPVFKLGGRKYYIRKSAWLRFIEDQEQQSIKK